MKTRFFQYQAKAESPGSANLNIDKFENTFHRPWTEPVRQRIAPALAIAIAASGLFAPVLTPTQISNGFEASYHQPLSEPVRFKARIPTGQQQALFFNSIPVVPGDWRQWLAEPVRTKPGLRASLQQVTSLATPVVPSPTTLLEGWYNWLSEPQRQKIGLKASLQQTIAYHPRLLPTANVTITMAANEINTDVALFGIFTYNVPVSAVVSLREIPVLNSGAASIEET